MPSHQTNPRAPLPTPSFLVAYKKEILIGLAVLLVILIGYTWAAGRQTSIDRAASADLFKAQKKAGEMIGNATGQAELYADVRRAHPDARIVWEAFALEYGVDRDAYDNAAAIKVGREFLALNPNHRSAPRFALGVAKLMTREGNLDDAEKLLENPRYVTPELQPERLFLQAQIQERKAESAKAAGDEAEWRNKLLQAGQHYNELSSKNRDSGWPEGIIELAGFAQVLINDRLAGKTHDSPDPLAGFARPIGPMPLGPGAPAKVDDGDDHEGHDHPPIPAANPAAPSAPAEGEAKPAAEEAKPEATENKPETATPAVPAAQ